MSFRGFDKREFFTPINRWVRTVPNNEEPPTFSANAWENLRIWGDQFVWSE